MHARDTARSPRLTLLPVDGAMAGGTLRLLAEGASLKTAPPPEAQGPKRRQQAGIE